MDKKYKYTRQLLKIAKREGGYTNKEIEKKAGLKGSSSSLASRWLNGHALATERQMQYFINNYGKLLKRQLEHLYYRYTLNGEDLVMGYIKLSGDIIFKHQIRIDLSKDCNITGKSNNPKCVSIIRILVIENDEGFKLLFQYRAGLIKWTKQPQNEKLVYIPIMQDFDKLFKSDNEESNWYIWAVLDCDSTDSLIDNFSKVQKSLLDNTNIVDCAKDSSCKKGESVFFYG